MRLFILLLIGISLCLVASAEKETHTEEQVTETRTTTTVKPAKKSSKHHHHHHHHQERSQRKLHKNIDDNRGKRTLYDFGNAGYLYSDIAARRAGYESEPNTYLAQQNGYYNGQDAIAQISNQFVGPFAGYPQYLEAPEPIIEIIIKDSNDTVPTPVSQPVVNKKKKEKVHVFYVNYKKDKNNKLHLETPIASLNNDENEEETDEIIDYPVAATTAAPLKTTTLRTIIHPDSEKYHSNSGIHVTFGTADKSQTGHILEEHNAESLQHQVIALPASTRADFGPTGPAASTSGASRFSSNALFSSAFQQPGVANNFYQNQEVPAHHSSHYFRKPLNQFQQQQPQAPSPNYQFHNQRPQQQFQQHLPPIKQQPQQPYQQNVSTTKLQTQQQSQQPSQQQKQRPSFGQSTPAPLSGKFPFLQELQQHAKYFVQQNQQYSQPQPKPQQQQPHKEVTNTVHIGQGQKPPHQPSYTSSISKQQAQLPQQSQQPHELQQQQPFYPTPNSYQPIKFRPTAAPLSPLPYKPEFFNNYQSQQYPLQQHHQQQQQQPQKSTLLFNRQPQFIHQPTFTVTSPPIQADYAKYSQFSTVPRSEAQVSRPQSSPSTQYQNEAHNNQNQYFERAQAQQNTHTNHKAQEQLNKLHKQYNVQSSEGTELLKSIPKFEQHITETVHSSNSNNFQVFASNAPNQVIHDIPAPNLGQTVAQASSQPAVQVNYNSSPQIRGHYITASSLNPQQYSSSTATPLYEQTEDGHKLMIVTPMPVSATNQYNSIYAQQPRHHKVDIKSTSVTGPATSSPFSVSNYHTDVFKQLESLHKTPQSTTTKSPSSTSSANKASQTLLELPDEVPEDLREQLLSSGILNNAQISVLDYDKVGGINIENLPAEHLKHFYGAGGGAQLSESNRVVSVLKPNGENVSLSAKEIERVKVSHSLPQKQSVNVKVVHFNKNNEQSVANQYVKPGASIAPTVHINDQRQYNRYLPLKINGAQFPLPNHEELRGKKIVSVVVLAPVDGKQSESSDGRSERDTAVDTREIKFLGGDLIKALVKKPTTENFKRWLEKEARTDEQLQSIVLLVAKSSQKSEQEIFMYDITSGVINKLNGELSSAFVNVAEENASAEDLEHASTLDQRALENMMQRGR